MIIYTDGSCLGNPGPGGWAWYCPSNRMQSVGTEPHTTNNRMELTAMIEAMRVPGVKTIFTDSKYCKLGVEQWSKNWVKNNWISSTGKPVKNVDLWKIVVSLKKDITIEWVKAHSKNTHNNFVDLLARNAAMGLKNTKDT
jgi:ribonuclease HI